MEATSKQIEKAKHDYNSFLRIKSISEFNPNIIGINEAEQRCQYHNNIVTSILNGNKELEKEWKMFFLREIIKSDNKLNESKAKINANKEASADILEPIKKLKKLGEYSKWLNTRGNIYRSEYFSKKYTINSVNAFLGTL